MPWLNMRAEKKYRGVHYIHPLKQREVEQLLDCIRGYPQVTKAVIFGSTVDGRCTPYSDVDVLFYGEPVPFYCPQNGQVYDILWESNIPATDSIREDIAREGVIIYEA